MDSPLLTKEEAAEYLRLSPKTLPRLTIPRVKIGRLVRYHLADLDAYIERSRRSPLLLANTPAAKRQPIAALPLKRGGLRSSDIRSFLAAS